MRKLRLMEGILSRVTQLKIPRDLKPRWLTSEPTTLLSSGTRWQEPSSLTFSPMLLPLDLEFSLASPFWKAYRTDWMWVGPPLILQGTKQECKGEPMALARLPSLPPPFLLTGGGLYLSP